MIRQAMHQLQITEHAAGFWATRTRFRAITEQHLWWAFAPPPSDLPGSFAGQYTSLKAAASCTQTQVLAQIMGGLVTTGRRRPQIGPHQVGLTRTAGFFQGSKQGSPVHTFT